MLVQSDTWIPARLATRWALLHKRRRSASKTLRNQLFTLKLMYCWAKSNGINLDELLLVDGQLKREQIKNLINELQNVRSKRMRNRIFLTEEKKQETGRGLRKRIAEAPVAVTIDSDLAVIENFLSWVSDPINVGVKPNHPQRAISIDYLNSTKAIVKKTLNAYRVGTLPSSRRNLLTPMS